MSTFVAVSIRGNDLIDALKNNEKHRLFTTTINTNKIDTSRLSNILNRRPGEAIYILEINDKLQIIKAENTYKPEIFDLRNEALFIPQTLVKNDVSDVLNIEKPTAGEQFNQENKKQFVSPEELAAPIIATQHQTGISSNSVKAKLAFEKHTNHPPTDLSKDLLIKALEQYVKEHSKSSEPAKLSKSNAQSVLKNFVSDYKNRFYQKIGRFTPKEKTDVATKVIGILKNPNENLSTLNPREIKALTTQFKDTVKKNPIVADLRANRNTNTLQMKTPN